MVPKDQEVFDQAVWFSQTFRAGKQGKHEEQAARGYRAMMMIVTLNADWLILSLIRKTDILMAKHNTIS